MTKKVKRISKNREETKKALMVQDLWEGPMLPPYVFWAYRFLEDKIG